MCPISNTYYFTILADNSIAYLCSPFAVRSLKAGSVHSNTLRKRMDYSLLKWAIDFINQ